MSWTSIQSNSVSVGIIIVRVIVQQFFILLQFAISESLGLTQ